MINSKNYIIPVQFRTTDINDDLSEYPSFECPMCNKGIVTIGKIDLIRFPSGFLSAVKYGDIDLNHFTCDRCDYKLLTNKFVFPKKIGVE